MRNNLMVRFTNEVLLAGPESTLPCNLSDEWLDILISQANSLAAIDKGDQPHIAELLAATLHILLAKSGGNKVSVDEEELFEYMANHYATELALEEINRRTDMQLSPATIATIFTNRSVTALPNSSVLAALRPRH